jgi:hypothetical protein
MVENCILKLRSRWRTLTRFMLKISKITMWSCPRNYNLYCAEEQAIIFWVMTLCSMIDHQSTSITFKTVEYWDFDVQG